MRRILLALTVSLAVHLGAVAVAAGVGLWRALSLTPSVKMQPIAIDVVKDLPLGAPPDKQPVAGNEPHVRKPRHRIASAHQGVAIPAAPDAGAPEPKNDAGALAKTAPCDGGGSIDGGRRRPGDLRSNGPEGSRLIALLRLDRLRASPDSDNTMAAVDQLLLLLPDRHRLIDGTGLDLYRDFDSLLLATPNPTDDTVTFLAARHHLVDAALKAALDRGAKAARRPITWRTVEGRPVGIRQQNKGPGPAGLDRDDRILALPMPALAIMATPAYAAQMLGPDTLPVPNTARAIDAGSGDARASDREARKPPGRPSWPDITARIEAEDSAMPDDAAFMMTATNLFGASGGENYVVPSTRGASDDIPPQPIGSDPGPTPQTLTLVVGAATPFIEILAEFKTADDADRWERELPGWKRKVVTNPAVFLSGFSSLVGRAETTREGNTLQTRIEVSTAELQRLLNLAANLTRSALAHPR